MKKVCPEKTAEQRGSLETCCDMRTSPLPSSTGVKTTCNNVRTRKNRSVRRYTLHALFQRSLPPQQVHIVIASAQNARWLEQNVSPDIAARNIPESSTPALIYAVGGQARFTTGWLTPARSRDYQVASNQWDLSYALRLAAHGETPRSLKKSSSAQP